MIISFFGSLFSLFFPSFLLSFSLPSVRPLSFNCYYSLSLLILFITDLFLSFFVSCSLGSLSLFSFFNTVFSLLL